MQLSFGDEIIKFFSSHPISINNTFDVKAIIEIIRNYDAKESEVDYIIEKFRQTK